MVLDMAHIVQKQLRKTDVDPFEPTAVTAALVRQGFNRRPALVTAVLQISVKLAFRIGAFGT